MNNQLTTFDFNNSSIRVIDRNGQPWFILADVCRAIGYAVKSNGQVNTGHALVPLDADEVITHQTSKTPGRPPKLVSESGVYKLVMRSDKPEAREFQNWVTKVVLPAIRKTGSYVMGEEKVATGELSLEEMTLRVVQGMQEKIAALTLAAEQAEAVTSSVTSTIAQAPKTITKVARTLPGVNVNKTKSDLAGLGYLWKHSNGSTYKVYRKHSHLFEEKFNERTGYSEITVTAEGVTLLHRLYNTGQLTLKVGFKKDTRQLRLVG